MGDSGSDGGKVVDAHAKVALIGEDRDRFDNWRSRVGGGGGVHILLPHGANARGAFLDLRNEAKFGTQCLSKIPGRRCICEQGADFAKGFRRFGRGDLLTDISQYCIEYRLQRRGFG